MEEYSLVLFSPVSHSVSTRESVGPLPLVRNVKIIVV